jgi:hypothetical protein
MKTISKTLILGAIAIMLFASVYANVGLDEADAVKAKKDKLKSAKAKKGWLAQTTSKHR